MNSIKTTLFFLLAANVLLSQSFAPKPGVAGSTAIYKDSAVFQSWGQEVLIERGWLDISDKSAGKAYNGLPEYAIGPAEGDIFTVVSLGDSGIATYYFSNPIINGNGPDFAVFENGFDDDVIELAFVEVSNDGTNFYRFPAITEVDTQIQLGNANKIDCRRVHNFAGKYRNGYGVPFQLEDLDSIQELDFNNIRYVRVIDCIGSLTPHLATTDSRGTRINDPWPTAFASGGFDLDGIGVIHQLSKVSVDENDKMVITISPNPFSDHLLTSISNDYEFKILSMEGKVVLKGFQNEGTTIQTESLARGNYLLEIPTTKGILRYSISKY